MTSSNDDGYGYIEEEEVEIPDINYETEWEEFGNIKLDIRSDNEKTELVAVPQRKLSCNKGKKVIKKKISEMNFSNKKTKHVVTYEFRNDKSEDSSSKSCNPGLAMFEGNALFDGTFFTFVGEYYLENTLKKTLNRKFRGKCELCTNPTYIVGTGSSTYNFLRHLRRKHGQKTYDAYLSYKETKNTRPKTNACIKVSNMIDKEGFVPMYVAVESTWKQFGNPRAKRPVSSVVLDKGVTDRILSDAHDFILNPSWYLEKSVPYRRTYLLHGPGGCGKSSFVFALASELNFGICVLHTTDRELTDEKLNLLLNTSPENCVILLEDIDAAFSRYDNTGERNRLTTNGILNCLDGVTAPEGRMIFITCSDISKLDPILLRPGRVDVKEHLGYCSQYQMMLMFKKFYGDTAHAAEFTREILKYESPVSPAQLQGFFLSHKHDDVERLKLDMKQIWDL